MSSNKIVSAAIRSILFSSAVAAAGFPALAQSQTAPAASAEIEEIVVTGSLIPIDLNTPGIPVTVMSSADIANSGASGDLLNVLLKTQPFFYGSTNLGSSNGNISSGSTNGGSQIALRNLPTLVLINGRRVAVSPVTATGGYNFVDVSSSASRSCPTARRPPTVRTPSAAS
jgi:iron complex outermembrane receptor protein